MRAVGVHPDVVVVTSRVWQTTCTAVRAGGEGFVIDSPVYPDELEVLSAVLEQAGFPATALLATHADWDHLLGRLAFPDASLGVAETTAARLTAAPGAAQRGLRDFDRRHYVRRPRPLSLPGVQALPVPGRCEVGAQGAELELVPADGHTEDGMAVWVAWAGVLVAGDYLSPVEIPDWSAGGAPGAYRATLGRLGALVERAVAVVPGHGPVLSRDDALRVLEEDLAYLEDVASAGAGATLPPGRDDAEQRRRHAANVRAVHA